MISAHNWTKGNDRSSDGGIIENNWANCRSEKLASSALRGWNISTWREERWTEEKPDLNDNEQNTRLHFASTPLRMGLLIWIICPYMSQCHMIGRRCTFWSPHPEPRQLFTSPRAHPGPRMKSLSSAEEVYLCAATALESLHLIKCVNSALGMWAWQNAEAHLRSVSLCKFYQLRLSSIDWCCKYHGKCMHILHHPFF